MCGGENRQGGKSAQELRVPMSAVGFPVGGGTWITSKSVFPCGGSGKGLPARAGGFYYLRPRRCIFPLVYARVGCRWTFSGRLTTTTVVLAASLYTLVQMRGRRDRGSPQRCLSGPHGVGLMVALPLSPWSLRVLPSYLFFRTTGGARWSQLGANHTFRDPLDSKSDDSINKSSSPAPFRFSPVSSIHR